MREDNGMRQEVEPKARVSSLSLQESLVILLACLCCSGMGLQEASAQNRSDNAKPTGGEKLSEIDSDTIAAWKKVGASVSWVGPWKHTAMLWSTKPSELLDPLPGL